MKKLSLTVAILLLLSLVTGCKIQNPDNTGSSGDSTETTGSSQMQETGNAANAEPVVKVSDSQNILTIRNAVIPMSTGDWDMSNDEYWSYVLTHKAMADYPNNYTPFVSKMENGVLVDGTMEVSFETDYDIVRCKVSDVAVVDDSDPDVETSSIGHKAKAEFDDRKVTVDIGWWHESNNWTKSHTNLSYGICVKDKSGTFHNYYFRVNYGTTDPVGLITDEDYIAFLSQEWYMRAFGCIFAKPEDISAKYYFYGGVRDHGQFTDEEKAYFKALQPNSPGVEYLPDMRMPVAKMNKALSILGVTVEDIQIPDHWVYYDKTDAYYFWVKDAYGPIKSVTKVEKSEDGIVKIYWETKDAIWGTATGEPLRPSDGDPLKMVMTMQLQPDGTYRVLSNLPQE